MPRGTLEQHPGTLAARCRRSGNCVCEQRGNCACDWWGNCACERVICTHNYPMCSRPPCRLQQRPCPALNDTSAASRPRGASCLVPGGQRWQNQAKPPAVTPNLCVSPWGSQLGRGVLLVNALVRLLPALVQRGCCLQQALSSLPHSPADSNLPAKRGILGKFSDFFFFEREKSCFSQLFSLS